MLSALDPRHPHLQQAPHTICPVPIDHCLYCGGSAREEFAAREMMVGLRHSFVYRRCTDCGSLWLADPPEDMAPYYGEGYYSLTEAVGASPRRARRRVQLLLRLPERAARRLAGQRGFPVYLSWFAGLGISPQSRIADVGSGRGALATLLASHGFTEVWGFDPFIESERDTGAVHLRRAVIEEAQGAFDLIMFNHSLEHVAGPVASLTAARERLAANGHVLVRVPVAGSYADRHYGADWVALDPPRHLGIPSRAGMLRAAGAAGLEIVRVFFDSEPLQFWASEQYQRDIPLCADASGCEPAMARPLLRRARRLNARGDGDAAGYVLRRAA
jgi:2-polyprenyl-3-methyl-5-hydroxy-6-metoxy-1,4-benzoquinol methylase